MAVGSEIFAPDWWGRYNFIDYDYRPCKHCNTIFVRSSSVFHKNKREKDGLDRLCRACKKLQYKKRNVMTNYTRTGKGGFRDNPQNIYKGHKANQEKKALKKDGNKWRELFHKLADEKPKFDPAYLKKMGVKNIRKKTYGALVVEAYYMSYLDRGDFKAGDRLFDVLVGREKASANADSISNYLPDQERQQELEKMFEKKDFH